VRERGADRKNCKKRKKQERKQRVRSKKKPCFTRAGDRRAWESPAALFEAAGFGEGI